MKLLCCNAILLDSTTKGKKCNKGMLGRGNSKGLGNIRINFIRERREVRGVLCIGLGDFIRARILGFWDLNVGKKI